jgi:Zn-dependent M28 family amino/carboxypeptidase
MNDTKKDDIVIEPFLHGWLVYRKAFAAWSLEETGALGSPFFATREAAEAEATRMRAELAAKAKGFLQ